MLNPPSFFPFEEMAAVTKRYRILLDFHTLLRRLIQLGLGIDLGLKKKRIGIDLLLPLYFSRLKESRGEQK